MLLVDTELHKVEADEELKMRIATSRPHKKLTHNRIYLDQIKKDDVLSHGAITNDYLIKREFKTRRLPGHVKRDAGKLHDTHLDADRRLALFSYTPDSFSQSRSLFRRSR